MSKIIALYDACVLYPAPLRDLLMQLAVTDLFHAKWTNQIHDEWISNLLKNRPDLTHEKLIKIRNLMNENVRDCLVEKFENIATTLKLPDKDDHHVLAQGGPDTGLKTWVHEVALDELMSPPARGTINAILGCMWFQCRGNSYVDLSFSCHHRCRYISECFISASWGVL